MVRMNARTLHARAERCRELLRVAGRDEVCEQLRQWADEFDDEADALERGRRPAESAND
jgi:ATP phosphoribosyltransferase regulatory subunit HisZ